MAMTIERPDVKADALLSVGQAAEVLGVSRMTIYRMAKDGRLAFFRRRSTGKRVCKGVSLLRLWGGLV